MRLANAARNLFHFHKVDTKEPEDPSLFDSGIGDWIFDLAVVAMIALVIGTVVKWAYTAIFH
jgi:hypothetical protein